MLGVIVVLVISWLILWLVAKKHISVLGIGPNKRRLKEFSVGFLLMATLCTLNLLGQSYFKGFSYVRNIDYGIWEGLKGTWWTFKAALFEELIFRGAILYLLIRKLGIIKGCILSAMAFGVYHWFSYDMLGGRIIPMIYVFLLTGAGGWLFAYAFAKTKSLYAPLGLHFGWIFMSIVIFSAGPLGDSLYVIEGEQSELNGWETLLFFIWQAFITPGIVTWYLIRKYEPVDNNSTNLVEE